MPEDKELFNIWYTEPLKHLEQMPDGQGGFVVLATACFLYERYDKAFLKSKGEKANNENLKAQLAKDFGVDQATANVFWDVIRDGMLHQGMPKQQNHGKDLLPKWGLRHSYPAMRLDHINGHPYLKVEPFKFMHRVLELWENNFDLLRENSSFPWASVGPVPE